MRFFAKFMSCLLFAWILHQNAGAQEAPKEGCFIQLSFQGLTNNVLIDSSTIQVKKFSDYLKIAANASLVEKGEELPVKISLSLPHFNFKPGHVNQYKNEVSHFFDPRKDASFSITLGKQAFATLYRSKEPTSVLPQVATPDYQLIATNQQNNNGQYWIQIRIMAGSILKESSELISAKEVPGIVFSDRLENTLQVKNPQPFFPKIKGYLNQYRTGSPQQTH